MRRVWLPILLLVLAAQTASGTAHAREAPQATVAHATRFEFLQDRQILFPIVINGQPAEAWLDSGASSSVVDAAFAARLGLQLGRSVRAQGVAGGVEGVRLARVDFQLGDLVLPGRDVAVMDLTALARVAPRPVQVILGRDVFDAAVLDIDFAARQIAFLARHDFRPPPIRPLPLSPAGNLRSFPIRVEGRSVAAILDLGNSGGLLIDRAWAEGRGLLERRRLSTQLSVGVDGPREGLVASLDRVAVGGVVFDDVPASITADLAAETPVNVGLSVLSRFHVTIDFQGQRLWLQPYPDAAHAPFRKNRAGLSVVAEGDHLRVTHVARASPAAAGGWQVGDAIIAVDGQPITRGYAESALFQWANGAPGRVVVLTLADGARRRLELADYY
ncbi:aspartyl protease family protein [Phenylobacterium sp.]|jgi:predicted aspartyl protease|uniref:aspartyl protease family protein n=1 Tax=Phenylobacterium sp. TaxID=1871053 RepID=UPI003783C732